ncbi:MAG TPA: hypothetical protein VK136_01970 [Bacillota bacterium]|nr:hypothetical protein [Bacillota bacterium]
MKRIGLYILLVLFIASVHKDLSSKTYIPSENMENEATPTTSDFSPFKVKVRNGETVLSIVERLNPNTIHTVEIKQIMHDFKTLNPHVKPDELKHNTYYYFPRYH